jgi:hypothetical protein
MCGSGVDKRSKAEGAAAHLYMTTALGKLPLVTFSTLMPRAFNAGSATGGRTGCHANDAGMHDVAQKNRRGQSDAGSPADTTHRQSSPASVAQKPRENANVITTNFPVDGDHIGLLAMPSTLVNALGRMLPASNAILERPWVRPTKNSQMPKYDAARPQ